jgi:hypothetical protein
MLLRKLFALINQLLRRSSLFVRKNVTPVKTGA